MNSAQSGSLLPGGLGEVTLSQRPRGVQGRLEPNEWNLVVFAVSWEQSMANHCLAL